MTEILGWEDIVPIPQDDGPSPVAQIVYSSEYKQKMDLFRAVVRLEECSERVLQLTADLLDLNAANYTIWQYRRKCLFKNNCDLNMELDYMDQFADDNPKNYQIWYHRRAIVEASENPSRELAFCAKVFEVDAKNYHAWAHRQWVLSTYQLWEGEIEFIENLILTDVRNNAAWNQRWFVIHKSTERESSSSNTLPMDVLHREIDYVFSWLSQVTLNESAWNYARGLARYHPEVTSIIKERCLPFVTVAVDDEDFLVSPQALSLFADLSLLDGSEASKLVAVELYERLIEIDSIRAKYWNRQKTLLLA